MVKLRPLAVPQLGSCASPGHAWWLRTARYSQGEAVPLGAEPLPELPLTLHQLWQWQSLSSSGSGSAPSFRQSCQWQSLPLTFHRL